MHKNNAVNLGGKELSVLQRSLKIIVVLCTLFLFRAYSQNDCSTDSTRSSVFEMRNTNYGIAIKENALGKFRHLSTGIVLAQKNISNLDFTNLNKEQISDMGWFCKKELEMDKKLPFLFRFRLGNLAYVNFLEGKK